MERFGAVRPPGHPGLLHILSCGEQEKARGAKGAAGVRGVRGEVERGGDEGIFKWGGLKDEWSGQRSAFQKMKEK